MADSKITALASIGTGTDPANDPLVIVDVSDVSPSGMSATGTTKKVTLNNLLACSPTATLASATITGDLTVDTSTLKVDSANNRVIVGHTSGSSAFQVTNAGAAGLEIQPTGVNSAPVILSYNRSGAAYTQLTLDASNIVHNLSGSTAMTLNSTGLGVGVSPANDKLLVLNTIGINTATTGDLSFRNVVGTVQQRIRYTDSDGSLTIGSAQAVSYALYFGGNTTTRAMTLDASGRLLVGPTSANASGGILQLSSGITFPATQVASSDANTLDDYEEGTWTIGLTFGGGSTGMTTATNIGRYTKIGRQVTVSGNLSLSNKGSSTGIAEIQGLPFTIANANEAYSAANVRFNGVSFADIPISIGAIGSTKILLQEITKAGVVTDITDADFTNTSSCIIGFTYTV